MKSQSPFPSMASILAEGRARQARATSCCDGPRSHDVPDAILKARTLPKLSAPRKGGSPPPVERPRLWEELARNPRKMGEMRKEGPPRPLEELRRPEAPAQGAVVTGTASNGEDCACQEAPVSAKASSESAGQTRHVSGDWVARVLSLSSVDAAALAGRQVRVGPAAWQAIQAAQESEPLWRRTRREIAKRRARFWPEETENQTKDPSHASLKAPMQKRRSQPPQGNEGAAGEVDCGCEDVQLLEGAYRYVDPLDGSDDNSGKAELIYEEIEVGGRTYTFVSEIVFHAWKSLDRAFSWLNALAKHANARGVCLEGVRLYLRRGRTWTGEEELAGLPTTGPFPFSNRWDDPGENRYGVEAVLQLENFKATEASPLVIAPWGDGEDPLLDGRAVAPTEPQYGDARVGLAFYDCCHVYVYGLQLRGFGNAIGIAGASIGHVYSGLALFENADGAIGFGSNEKYANAKLGGTYANKYLMSQDLVVQGLYPQDINVYHCQLHSNGYDTGAQSVGIGHLSTNCSIIACSIVGDSKRGVDGITGNGASSGHLIQGNSIGGHSKLCYPSSVTKPFFREIDGICMGVTLVQPCHDQILKCRPTTMGFTVRYDASASAAVGDRAAHGEDGIDLKAVRKRTVESKETTVITNNTIWGHWNFTGITINDASQGVQICRNRIFQNETGIGVTNSETDEAWYVEGDPEYPSAETKNIYIYRNLIYMNSVRGVHVSSDSRGADVFRVSDVYLVGNTIAHNLSLGVHIVSTTSGGWDVSQIGLYNNLILRNGVVYSNGRQVQWNTPERLAAAVFGGNIESDFNGYLGWYADDGATSDAEDAVISWGASETRTVEMAGRGWAIERSGVQFDDLDELALGDEDEISDLETTDPLIPGGNLLNAVMNSSVNTVRGMDYTIGLRSLCVERGVPEMGVEVYDLGAFVDLAAASDLDEQPVSGRGPDIGAFEVNARMVSS